MNIGRCYIIGPHSPSVLYMVVCICQSQSSTLSLPLSPLVTMGLFSASVYFRGNILYVNCFVFLKCEPPHEANLSFYCSHLIQPKFKAIQIFWRNPEITWQPNFCFNNHVFCPTAIVNSEFHPVSAVFLLRPYWSGDGGTHFSFQGMEVNVVLALN